MIDIAQAIQALDINAKFVINGSPSNEAEYKTNVKFVSGADENGTAIFKDTQDFTWEQVSAKQTELQADYDAKQYQRDRVYPSIGDQLDMLWHSIDQDGELQTKYFEFYQAIKAVKVKHPKNG